MEILKFPDHRLFKKCKPVTVFGPELKALLDAMLSTMLQHSGVGLAANQVGLDFRMCIIQTIDGQFHYMVNPTIIWYSAKPSQIREGCLSAPKEFLVLPRASMVKVKFQDETGVEHVRIFNDLTAVCVQHEIEHLDGKSFLENKSLSKNQKKQLKGKWGIK